MSKIIKYACFVLLIVGCVANSPETFGKETGIELNYIDKYIQNIKAGKYKIKYNENASGRVVVVSPFKKNESSIEQTVFTSASQNLGVDEIWLNIKDTT